MEKEPEERANETVGKLTHSRNPALTQQVTEYSQQQDICATDVICQNAIRYRNQGT